MDKTIEDMIIEGMARRLNELYPDYPVYEGFPEQIESLPCFFITQSTNSANRRIGFDRNNPHCTDIREIKYQNFHIEFHAELDKNNQVDVRQLRNVANDIRDRLDCIKLENGDFIRFYPRYSYIYGKYSLITYRARYSTIEHVNDGTKMRVFKFGEHFKNEKN